jgi:hypothetical protein
MIDVSVQTKGIVAGQLYYVRANINSFSTLSGQPVAVSVDIAFKIGSDITYLDLYKTVEIAANTQITVEQQFTIPESETGKSFVVQASVFPAGQRSGAALATASKTYSVDVETQVSNPIWYLSDPAVSNQALFPGQSAIAYIGVTNGGSGSGAIPLVKMVLSGKTYLPSTAFQYNLNNVFPADTPLPVGQEFGYAFEFTAPLGAGTYSIVFTVGSITKSIIITVSLDAISNWPGPGSLYCGVASSAPFAVDIPIVFRIGGSGPEKNYSTDFTAPIKLYINDILVGSSVLASDGQTTNGYVGQISWIPTARGTYRWRMAGFSGTVTVE